MANVNGLPELVDQCRSLSLPADESAVISHDISDNASWKRMPWGRLHINEAAETGSKVMSGSVSWPALSDPIMTSFKHSSPDGILQKCANQNPDARLSLGSPNEQQNAGKQFQKTNSTLGKSGHSYEQDRRHEWRPISHRGGFGGRPFNMQFPRQQPQTYQRPLSLIPPPVCHVPFNSQPLSVFWSFQAPFGFPEFRFPVYQYVTHLQPEIVWEPSFRNHQVLYAAQQPTFTDFKAYVSAKLMKQIEYYFSSENLCSDLYLKRHMDDHGWVPIALISNFNRVKELTDNINFIVESLRASNAVEVQGDRIRKRHQWEKWLLPQSARVPRPMAAE